MKKQITAALTAMAMLCTGIPVTAPYAMPVAAEAEFEYPTSGLCGENVEWVLDDVGTLTISGTGEMEYYCAMDVGVPLGGPWDPDAVRSVVIEEGVTSVGGGAFANHKNLTSVTLPESITLIDYNAFSGCAALQSITIPKNVKEISYAFGNCTNLKEIDVDTDNPYYYSVGGALVETEGNVLLQYPIGRSDKSYTVPEGIREIGSAFSLCEALECISLPASLEEYDRYDFTGCPNLTTIEVSPDNLTFKSIDGVLLSKDGTQLLQVPPAKDGAYTVPDGVTDIEYNAFHSSRLSEVTIPEGIAKLDSFYQCKNLTKVTLPSSLKKIEGWSCFGKCTSLETIELPEGLESVDGFDECTSLTKVTFPESIRKIAGFGKCTALKELTFPEGPTEIGGFFGCTALTSVTFPKSAEKISGFEGCTSLSSVTIQEGTKKLEAFRNCTGLCGDLIIPLSVEDIGGFGGCTNLQRIIFEGRRQDMCFSGHPFENLLAANSRIIIRATQGSILLSSAKEKGLIYETVTNDGKVITGGVGDTVRWSYDQKGTVTLNGTGETWSYGFEYGEIPPWEEAGIKDEITSVVVEDGITKLDGILFMGCPNLTDITIPDSITYLDASCFWETPFLSDVTDVKYLNGWVIDCGNDVVELVIEDGTKGVAANAIQNKTITTVTFPDSVICIGEGAFGSCEKLNSIRLPDRLAYLGASAFAACTHLMNLEAPESIEYVGGCTFGGTPLQTNQKILYIGGWAANSAPTIETAKIAPGTKAISNCAFYGREELTSVEIPDSVTYIGNEAFAYSAITSIVIPDSVTDCGGSLFNFCRDLKPAVLSDNITELKVTELPYSDDTAFFGNCRALDELHLPAHLKTLDGIYCCSSLKTIEIPAEVVQIDRMAYCPALEELTIPENVKAIAENALNECTALKKITVLNRDLVFEGRIISASAYDEATGEWKENYSGTICGYTGSTAQAYAEQYGLAFESLDAPAVPLGDLNGDTVVNASDAAQILIAAAAIGAGNDPGLTDAQKTVADVNADGSINASDAAVVLIYAAAVGAGDSDAKITDFVQH